MKFRESAGQRWILVADGDEASARLVASFLLQARLRAFPTAHVELLDMPGYDLVRKLRALEPALPIVMTTADYSPATEVQARQLGIVQYLHKPIDLSRLDRVVSRIFGHEAEASPRITVASNGNAAT